MKKTVSAISAFALLMGITASCQKETDSLQKGNQNTEFTVTATIADNLSKVSYAEDGTNLQPTWEVDDIIIGFDDAAPTNTYGFKVTAVNGGTATLAIVTEGEYAGSKTTTPSDGTKMYTFYAPGKKPSDIDTSLKTLTVSLASQSKDVVPALMTASATVSGSSLSLSFENKTAVIAIKNPTMAEANKAYTSIVLSGTGINTEVAFSLDGSGNLQTNYQTAGAITKAVEFTSHATTRKGAAVTYIVACPLASAAELTFTANNGEKFSKTGKTMAAGNYYYMSPTFIPEGALSGEFTVDDDGTKVRFSRGNLYYDGSAFKFEENQYSFASAWSTSYVSHFYWSKTASVACEEEYEEYEPSIDDIFFTNATTTMPNSDFTVNGAKGVWRTLSGGNYSYGEWKYLLHERIVNEDSGEGYTYQWATINSDATGVNGLIIYPDGYTAQTGATSYTASEWTAMETAGCVFLPAAGLRDGSDVGSVGDFGCYWSSTAVGKLNAYNLYFGSDDVRPDDFYDRIFGFSVRLVCAAQ